MSQAVWVWSKMTGTFWVRIFRGLSWRTVRSTALRAISSGVSRSLKWRFDEDQESSTRWSVSPAWSPTPRPQ